MLAHRSGFYGPFHFEVASATKKTGIFTSHHEKKTLSFVF